MLLESDDIIRKEYLGHGGYATVYHAQIKRRLPNVSTLLIVHWITLIITESYYVQFYCYYRVILHVIMLLKRVISHVVICYYRVTWHIHTYTFVIIGSHDICIHILIFCYYRVTWHIHAYTFVIIGSHDIYMHILILLL